MREQPCVWEGCKLSYNRGVPPRIGTCGWHAIWYYYELCCRAKDCIEMRVSQRDGLCRFHKSQDTVYRWNGSDPIELLTKANDSEIAAAHRGWLKDTAKAQRNSKQA